MDISGVKSWTGFILPAIALGWNSAGSIARLTRSTLVEVLQEDYIDTAKAKGLGRGGVIILHGLRNAMLPVITMMALQISSLLSGAVISETIFSINGIGRLAVDAISRRDIPLLQGTVLFTTVIVIVGNLIADCLYTVLDPRNQKGGVSMKKREHLENTAEQEALAAQLGESDTFIDKMKRMAADNKLAVFSAFVILFFLLLAVCAPLLTPYSFEDQDLLSRLSAPSAKHLLGTDELGRDVLTRLLYGARVSLAVGIIPTIASMVIGVLLGMISGYVGGIVDAVIMRLADVVLSFPSLLLAMVIMYTLGDGITSIFIALAITSWAGVARVIRSETLTLRETEYVEAARSMGVKDFTIILRHVFPNCIPSLIVLFTLDVPSAILSESALSFLGIGVQLPNSSWGLMVNMGRTYLYNAPWLSLVPSAAIMLVVLAFNFLGDGLRDVLDPHLKNS